MTIENLELKLAEHPHSPLFARLASEYLSTGRIDEAKSLLQSGIERYPNYATAHLILTRCHLAEKNHTAALDCFDRAQQLFPQIEAPAGLVIGAEHTEITPPVSEEIEIAREDETKHTLPEVTEGPENVAEETITASSEPQAAVEPSVDTFVEDVAEIVQVPEETSREPQPDTTTEEEVVAPEFEQVVTEIRSDVTTPSESVPVAVEKTEKIEEAIEELAIEEHHDDFQSMEPPVEQSTDSIIQRTPEESVSEKTEEFSDEGRIVSKTLAEIYASQGAYGEAIVTYQLLKHRHPDRTAEIDRRIGELALKLQAKMEE